MSDNVTAATAGEELPAVSVRQLFKNRQFLRLWVAQFVSTLGDWLAIMALFGTVAYSENGTPYEVAGIMISFITPWAFLGPVAGVFVDRWDVKRTMIASDILRACVAVAFAFAANLYQLYGLVFALSAVSTFFMPAQSVAIPSIVRKEELLLANSINAQTIQLNKVIGPAIAGLLVGWFGAKACFYIDGATFIFSAVALSGLKLATRRADHNKDAQSVFKELSEGLRFTVRHRAIFFVILSIVVSILAIGAFDALISVYIRDVIHKGEGLFGALVSVVGVGTMAGAMVISRTGRGRSKVNMVIAGILVMGVSVFIIAALSEVASVLASSFILGFGVAYVLVPSQTLIQEETPHEMLGRVSSTSFSLMTVAQLFAFLMAGAIAERIGIINLYYVVAAMLAVIAGFGYVYARVNQVGGPRVKAAAAGAESPPAD